MQLLIKRIKKEYSKWVGFGLIMGVAIGYGFGSIINSIYIYNNSKNIQLIRIPNIKLYKIISN
jgi:RsiW-degrading membrane proteinase PrsW (M82 family)